MKSPEWNESAIESLRNRIESAEVQQAFDLLVRFGVESPSLYCALGGQKNNREFRYNRMAPRGSPFGFTVAREQLLFTLRPLGLRTLGVSRTALSRLFGEVRQRAGKALQLVIRSPREADILVQSVLSAWPGALPPSKGIPAGITRDDVLSAVDAILAGAGDQFGESRNWDVVVDGQLQPPKRLLGVAASRRSGRELSLADFEGDREFLCHRILEQLGFDIVPKGDRRAAREAAEVRIARQIRERTDMLETEREQLILARRGQGFYRASLERFELACRVTRLADRRHLRASHIKPWRDCNDREKLDGHNGLLLAPHVGHLFDQGHITFSDEGNMVVSRHLNRAVLKSWGLALPLNVGAFRPAQCVYLAYHREHVFEKGDAGRRKN